LFNVITVILIEDNISIMKEKLILFRHHFITGIGMTFIVMFIAKFDFLFQDVYCKVNSLAVTYIELYSLFKYDNQST